MIPLGCVQKDKHIFSFLLSMSTAAPVYLLSRLFETGWPRGLELAWVGWEMLIIVMGYKSSDLKSRS